MRVSTEVSLLPFCLLDGLGVEGTAVQSLDFVNKYEGRTLWSSSGADLVSRWGATTVILRARPAGQLTHHWEILPPNPADHM